MTQRRFASELYRRLQLSNSPMTHVRHCADMHHRPGSLSGLGKPVVMRAWRLRHSRQINAVLAHKGRAERQGVSPRPRRHVRAHGSVCPKSTRQTQPRKRLNARVPHANGLCGLLHVPGVVTGADAPRSCELSPGHALGPSARRAGVCPRPFEDPRSSTAVRVRHRSGHPHPAPRFEDDRDAPLIGAGRG